MDSDPSAFRTISLLRHAKSSWREEGLSDHDRPLNGRGEKAARLIGEAMLDSGIIPELTLCSSATRARMTWDRVSEALACPVPLQIEPDLYLAAPRTVLNTLRGVSPDVEHVLIVGHNPTMQALALGLSEDSRSPARDAIWHKYPTAGLTVLRMPWPDWYSTEAGAGEILSFIRPRDLE